MWDISETKEATYLQMEHVIASKDFRCNMLFLTNNLSLDTENE